MKDVEVLFFAYAWLIRENVNDIGWYFTYQAQQWMCDNTSACDKQIFYYLRKWNNKGFADYGVSLRTSWLEPESFPKRYKYICLHAEEIIQFYINYGWLSAYWCHVEDNQLTDDLERKIEVAAINQNNDIL